MRLFPLLAVLALPLAVSTARAATPEPREGALGDPQILQLHREIAALRLDKALNLSPAQARQLLPLLMQAQTRRDQIRTQLEQRKPEIVAAMTQARDELKSTGTLQPATRQKLQQIHAQNRALLPRNEIQSMAQQVQAILTPGQLKTLKAFEPAPLQARDEGTPPEAKTPRAQLAKLRILASDEFAALTAARAK